MKITAVRTSILQVPNPPPRSTFYPFNRYVVARIQTDEGIAGLGYTMLVNGDGASAVRAYLVDNLIPPSHRRRPAADRQDLAEDVRWRPGHPQEGHPGLCDQRHRYCPLGPSWESPWESPSGRSSVRSATACPCTAAAGYFTYPVKDLVKAAEDTLAFGSKYYKLKIGIPDVMENVKRVGELRKALGDDMKILVDANQRWDVHTNIRVGKLMEPYDIFWYEEPVYADNIAQCAEVARNINIPVATGGKRVHPLRLPRSHRSEGRGHPQSRCSTLRRFQ